ncbi:class I SAM-dependent methyltransferase [Elongatibacter sediminis]|uniref:Methyltransferase n=1 Tax=Elongatibacter sediminis TaxID=3119006 RepID=A0AAW9RBP4_9GAMM
MKKIHLAPSYLAAALAWASPALATQPIEALLEEAVAGDHRNPVDRARDDARHPIETLMFLGLDPDMTVVEVWPSSGWYTAILAPALRHQGTFYAAGFAMTAERTPQWRKDVQTDFAEALESRPDRYDHVVVTELSIPERTTMAPPGSADLVLTFRNVHNWIKGGYADEMFRAMARALKPGGILGVVEHRALPGTDMEQMKQSGYVTEQYVIELAAQAGLRLDARSEVNANPRDTRNHPAGVWSLPPGLRHCRSMDDAARSEACRSEYLAIGESDRMTLRFRKNEAGTGPLDP